MIPRRLPVRWGILTLLFCVTVINFVDRQALSVLAPIIRYAFHLSTNDASQGLGGGPRALGFHRGGPV